MPSLSAFWKIYILQKNGFHIICFNQNTISELKEKQHVGILVLQSTLLTPDLCQSQQFMFSLTAKGAGIYLR